MAPSGCSMCSFRRTPRPGLTQNAGQGRLADLDRLPPEVRPVQLQQIECIEKGLWFVPAMAEQVEGSHPLLVAHTTSPSIRQDRTLRWFTASTTSG